MPCTWPYLYSTTVRDAASIARRNWTCGKRSGLSIELPWLVISRTCKLWKNVCCRLSPTTVILCSTEGLSQSCPTAAISCHASPLWPLVIPSLSFQGTHSVTPMVRLFSPLHVFLFYLHYGNSEIAALGCNGGGYISQEREGLRFLTLAVLENLQLFQALCKQTIIHAGMRCLLLSFKLPTDAAVKEVHCRM